MRQNSKRRIKKSSSSIQAQRSKQRSKKRWTQEKQEVGEYIDGKMCEICKGQEREESLLLCDRCDDSYHIFCLDPPMDHLPQNEWICFICSAQISDQTHKNYRRTVDLQDIYCHRCKERLNTSQYIKGINQLNQEVKISLDKQTQLKCLYCNCLFHNFCFSPRKNSLNCWQCEKKIRKNGPKCHDDFMKFINRCANSIYENRCDLVLLEDLQNNNNGSENYRHFRFKIPQYMTSWQSIVANQASIYYAFETKGLTYIDEQLYAKQQMPVLMQKNNPAKDSNGPIKRLHPRDEQTFEQFKKNSQKGYAGPIQIREDRVKGFYLVATQFIESNTIISQYVGEIKTARDALQHEDNDSIFVLLRTARSQESLDIVPEKYGNISRFFLGINNELKKKGGYRKIENVKSLRFSYKGRIRLLLHTSKPIQAGQALYFDYNGSAFQEYPTDHFVV